MARLLLAFLVLIVGFLAARRLLDTGPSPAGTRDDRHYRPRGRSKRSREQPPPPYTARSIVRRSALAEMRDALSGAPLDADGELFRCAECQSFYSVASVRALALDNSARCINCGSIHRIAVEVID